MKLPCSKAVPTAKVWELEDPPASACARFALNCVLLTYEELRQTSPVFGRSRACA